MKKLKKLGAILSREEQKKISGGYTFCVGQCGPGANYTCRSGCRCNYNSPGDSVGSCGL